MVDPERLELPTPAFEAHQPYYATQSRELQIKALGAYTRTGCSVF
jgi:hypothetical protein